MKPILELLKKRSRASSAGFALASTLIMLSILAGIQLWQMQMYRKQMETYAVIKRGYQLDILTNQVRLQLIEKPAQTEFMIKEVQILLKDKEIFIKYPNGNQYQRNFSQSR